MTKRQLMGVFPDEDTVFGALVALRRAGFEIAEVFAPYAVHGLDRAAGLRRSRIGFVTVTAAALGSISFYLFQDWVSAMNWPLNIGGKPYSSAPAWIPVVFEVGVLAAGLATVLALFVRSGLYPGKKPDLVDPRVTDDRFAVMLDLPDAGFDMGEARRICMLHGAESVEEVSVPDRQKETAQTRDRGLGGLAMSSWAKLNGVLSILVLGVIALGWSLDPDPTQRNFEVLPGMVTPVAYESFSTNAVLSGGLTQQPPPVGTIPRRHLPLHYEATPEDAQRAGLELENPYDVEDAEALARGEFVYYTYCNLCHGAGGEGDGPVASRGFPTPASLLAANARDMADGKVFHVVTYGQGNMPGHAAQIEPSMIVGR